MDTFWWRAAWGLCLVQLSLAQIDLNITCRYKGVFHVEKNGRYSISKTEAADLCKAFNCTLPTMAQMEAALRAGFETCRYGFIDGHVVIPRIHPNSICAANNTGVYILTSNTSQYDTYCFNASAPPEEDCTSVTDLPNAFEGPITITIVNRDGTRYTKKGEYRTNPDDINPSTTPEEDMSSGSSSERSTSGGYNIFHTHLPTVYPTPDQDSPWVPSNPETTPATTLMSTSGTTSKTATKRQEAQDWFSWWFQPSATKIHLHTTTIMAAQPLMQVTTTGTDSNIISAGWEATEENEDESDRHPSYSGSDTDDDEDFISSTTASARDSHQNQRVTVQSQEDRSWTYFFDPVSHPMGRGHQTERRMDVDTSHSTTLQPSAGPNTGLVEDLDRTGPLSVTTQQSDTQSFSTSRGGLEEDKDHPMTASPTSSNRNDGTGGRRGENLPEDSTTSVEGYTPYSPDTNEYRTLIPVTPAKAGSPEVTVVGDSTSNVDLSLSEDQDSSHDPSGRSYTTHGSESAGHSSGSQERGANTTSGPMRKPQIPEWLIILASLLALALILAVCIAVNSRRRCGQKKKLVINSGNGTMEERKPSGLNGEASKSQEMVHLVNKESSETPDQFMTADERQNLQNVDMKIGV
ncbi:CD44 antigen isoform X8 [Neophocaena asiaeorientalis asiaeorientalis]|uniref:CD44 antigen n=1 Tax=Neophocaena asiaeorientalis asiaeorientalis TaxID=1706337 RepID=A0A341C0H1_NEOAA|nr:CD44 antigen isoform X8 [Neophocaena asiaeorientalis asiaeorientalis]